MSSQCVRFNVRPAHMLTSVNHRISTIGIIGESTYIGAFRGGVYITHAVDHNSTGKIKI